MMLATVRRTSSRRSAFTLLEVMVVVAILVILATIATIATTKYIEDARKTKAHLGCQALATAIESYRLNAANPGLTEEEKMPQDISNLYNVPFGGQSFLRNGQADTIDPWGKPYQFELRTRPDGTTYLLVWTTAPDANQTPISQFGIGPNSQPPETTMLQ
jgi:general secretion pathway protein G